MTDMIKGSVHFLTVAPSLDNGNIALVGFVRGLVDAYATVRIDRLLDGKVDTANGYLSVGEVTDSGSETPITTTTGSITLTVKTGGMIRAGWRVWEFLILSKPGGQGAVTFRLSAGVPQASIPVEEVAKSERVTIAANMMNTAQPPKVTLEPKVLPRLSVGLNHDETVPESAPANYRGFWKGGGDPANLPVVRKAADIAALLHQIFFQLDAPYTFDPAWDQQAGTNSWTELSRSAFTVSPITVAEERWARLVTEMILLTVYMSPSNLYGTFGEYAITAEAFLNATNPYFGLGFVCQNMATFGVASRGVNLGKRIVNAGSNAAPAVMLATPAGQWYTDVNNPAPKSDARSGKPGDLMDGPSVMNLLPLLQKVPDYGPGSIHLFSNQKPAYGPITGKLGYDELLAKYNAGTPVVGSAANLGSAIIPGNKTPSPARMIRAVTKQKDYRTGKDHTITDTPAFLTSDLKYTIDNQPVGAHVAFAVRVRHDLKKVQFLDTGALNVSSSTSDLFASQPGYHSGNYDSPGTTQVESIAHQPYKGTGIFPPLDVDGAKALNETVLKLARARPLGLARFALLDRSKLNASSNNNPAAVVAPDGALIYASPLLPMWGTEETQNYYISRYLWSLRNMPNAANLEAVWMLYVPKKAKIKNTVYNYAEALATSSRDANVIAVAKALLPGQDFPRELAAVVSPLQDLVVRVTGKVGTLAQKGSDVGAKHLLHKLEGRTPTGIVHLPLDRSFPQAPGDFKSSQLPPYFGG